MWLCLSISDSITVFLMLFSQDGRVHVFYSTPSIYLKALHDAGQVWGVKTDDFFPYAHCAHCYWTGFYTSRPTLKGYVRQNNNLLQVLILLYYYIIMLCNSYSLDPGSQTQCTLGLLEANHRLKLAQI